MDLIFVRHTQPDVEEGICYGRLDLALADTFEQEADAVMFNLPKADVLVSSPMQRCVQLAKKIAQTQSLPVNTDERLREMDFGHWEGKPWDELPRAELDDWRDNFYDGKPHGGESVKMLVTRVRSAISDFRRTGLTHIIVCHSGVIKAAAATGTDVEHFSLQVPFGGVHTLVSS